MIREEHTATANPGAPPPPALWDVLSGGRKATNPSPHRAAPPALDIAQLLDRDDRPRLQHVSPATTIEAAIYSACTKVEPRVAVRLIFDRVDRLLTAGQFDECTRLLSCIDMGRISVEAIIALLTITLTARDVVSAARGSFWRAAERRLTNPVHRASLFRLK